MTTAAAASHSDGVPTLSTTPRRVLHSGTSLWAASYGISVPCTPLKHDVVTDVVVVGAGISGALVAYALIRRGHRVVIVDRRAPLTGSTLASTALLQFEIDLPLSALAEKIGVAKARRAWQRSLSAVRGLGDLVARERIRCGWEAKESLYLAGDSYGARALRREERARERAGIPGKFIGPARLRSQYGIERTGALVSSGSATANPAQLTAGLLRRCAARGARIYSPADVCEISAGRDGVVLGLANGPALIANDVILCTGYEMLPAIPLAGHTVKSTWAIATEAVRELPAWLRTTVLWEGSDPYLYLRTTADGRIIAGGEDEESATRHRDGRALLSKSARILRKVEALVPGIEPRVSHRWGGAFGESPTGLPIIDRVPGMHHCHVLAGFGGNGITHSVIGSEIIATAIGGGRDPDSDLFRAPR